MYQLLMKGFVQRLRISIVNRTQDLCTGRSRILCWLLLTFEACQAPLAVCIKKKDYALIMPESHVFSSLPEWTNTPGAYLITPAMGSHFVMYLANMQGNSRSRLPLYDVKRLLVQLSRSRFLKLPCCTKQALNRDPCLLSIFGGRISDGEFIRIHG